MADRSDQRGFTVTLENFEGPFDLYGLISKREPDITEVALARLLMSSSPMRIEPDLSRTSEFLVVAATLLDMKARSLLPHDDEQLEEDLEYLEARDLLFSRLCNTVRSKKSPQSLVACGKRTPTCTRATPDWNPSLPLYFQS